jgi:hypothetical protein
MTCTTPIKDQAGKTTATTHCCEATACDPWKRDAAGVLVRDDAGKPIKLWRCACTPPPPPDA